jgi:hemolysin III
MRFSVREPVNGLTHLAGAILSAIGLVVLVAIAVENQSVRQIVGFSIFGTSLVAMYCASAFYHSLRLTERGVARMRRIDHMMIYILIAGTYTPVCLVLLRGRLGLGLLIAVWSLAAMGVLQTMAWMHAPDWLSTALYIGMGWLAALVIKPILTVVPIGFFYWLLAGGIIYTLGAVIRAAKWPRAGAGRLRQLFGYHEIWHLCVMAGSFAHYWAILTYASKVV